MAVDILKDILSFLMFVHRHCSCFLGFYVVLNWQTVPGINFWRYNPVAVIFKCEG